jgi:predicted HAD superfamily Cof-like phosphohydrolase
VTTSTEHRAHKMAMEPMERLREFHDAFGVERAADVDGEELLRVLELRRRLIAEEWVELDEELEAVLQGEGDVVSLAKEMADLLVVVFGAAEVLDIPLEAVFVEVMESNMSKLGPEGVPLRREDGKILKPSSYRPPDVAAVLGIPQE